MNHLKTLLVLMVIFTSISFTSKYRQISDDNWQTLFNGENLDGWIAKFYHHDLGDNYAETFRVTDGKIQVNYDNYKEFNNRFGHLFYQTPFSSFHLKFEYRFTDQWMNDAPSYTYRNSGIMFHSQDPKTILKEQDWPISVEYQILAGAGDGKPRPTGNMCSPGTEVYFEGEKYPQHCINSSSITLDWDEWVSVELIVYSVSLVIHIVNGEKVLEYTKPQIGGGVANGFNPDLKIENFVEGWTAILGTSLKDYLEKVKFSSF